MLMNQISDLANAGVTHVWLPPPSHSVAPEGLLFFFFFPIFYQLGVSFSGVSLVFMFSSSFQDICQEDYTILMHQNMGMDDN